MQRLWELIRSDYRTHRVATQMTSLKLKSFCDPDKIFEAFPELGAKAAETKDLVSTICRIWEIYMDRGAADHRRVLEMMRHLVALQHMLHTHASKPILPLEVARQFHNRVNDFLHCYSLLANSSDREGVLLFSIVPKHHWSTHMVDSAIHINPRNANCSWRIITDSDHMIKLKFESFNTEEFHRLAI